MTLSKEKSVLLNSHINHDFLEYAEYSKSRTSLITSGFESEIKDLYSLLYLYTKLVVPYKKINKKNKTADFMNESKIDLITGFDLLNINYLKASKKTLRSAIESFFRFSLEFERYAEYQRNRERKVYEATQTLKDLKSMVDTHKVGKMTRYTIGYFTQQPVHDLYCDLNKKYSELSSYVHVNSENFFTPHAFLSNYSELNKLEINDYLEFYKGVLLDFLLILYSHEIFYPDILKDSSNFLKLDIQQIEYYGGNTTLTILDALDKYRNQLP